MKIVNLVAVGLALSVMGCSSGPNIVGKWVPEPTATQQGKDSDFAKGFQQGMDKMNSVEFRADKTFTRTMLFGFEGTYQVSGNAVTMTFTKAMGMEISKMPGYDPSKFKPQVGTISADGKSLTITDDSGKPSKYVRESS